jgi:hypothetical protein
VSERKNAKKHDDGGKEGRGCLGIAADQVGPEFVGDLIALLAARLSRILA